MSISIGALEAFLSVLAVLIIVPVSQVVTLRVGYNGLRELVEGIDKTVKGLASKVNDIEKWIAVREDREKGREDE